MIDDTWYVAVASQGDPPRIVDETDPTGSPPWTELPVESATVDGWTVQVARPPADVGTVCIGSDMAMVCFDRGQ